MAILADGSAKSLHASSPNTSSPERGSSPTAGPATAASTSSATPTNRAVSALLVLAGWTPASCCPQFTAWPRWPNGGSWVPIKGRSTRRTCRATSTSSSSASTDAAPAAEAWSSTACSNSPSPTLPSVTATGRRPAVEEKAPLAATHRAWTGPERLNRGECPDLRYSGQMNSPEVLYLVPHWLCAGVTSDAAPSPDPDQN